MDNNTENFFAELQPLLEGELYTDQLYRYLYSTDASDYQILPVAVLCPRSVQDVRRAVRCAAKYGIPLISRGAGTSLSGQTIGAGLVVDYSRYLDRVLGYDDRDGLVEVEPGVSRIKVNSYLQPFRQKIGPDPSSSQIATIGGMSGNNSTGLHSIQYGMMVDNVQELEVVLAGGELVNFGLRTTAEIAEILEAGDIESVLYRGVIEILEEYREDILAGYPQTWRNVAGYNLNYLLQTYLADGSLNLASLLVGSEGTLGSIVKVKVRTVTEPLHTCLALVHFDDLQQAADAVQPILDTGVAAVEFTDRYLIELTDKNPIFSKIQATFIEGNPEAVLIVEYASDRDRDLKEGLERLATVLHRIGHRGPVVYRRSPEEVAAVWNTRKATFGLLMSKRGDDRPLSFADDATVPIPELGSFIRELRSIFSREGVEAAFVGHASAGCIHVNPIINRKEEQGIAMMERLGKAIAKAAIERKGTTSGEHGEGIAKGYFNEQLFGTRLHQAFRRVKGLFDPGNLMNPGKIIDAPLPWDTTIMRVYPDYRTPLAPAETYLDFSAEGGFAGLVEMCNGAGFCRKDGPGVMCPSYRVTKDERHSTRGRANALRAAIKGELPEGLSDRALYETLDLCLECKACKQECPSVVDMAKMKYEYLAQYQDRHGVPLRNRIFANVHTLNARGRKWRTLTNFAFRNSVFRWFLEVWTGIDRRRTLPRLHAVDFQEWFSRRSKLQGPELQQVVLWDDTYLTYNYPEIGMAAVKVLEATGLEVILARGRKCCGRPMVSKGLLGEARKLAAHNVQVLLPYAQKGIPILGLEPSCIATLKDEYNDLLATESARLVAGNAFFMEDYLMNLFAEQRLVWKFRNDLPARKVLFHGHCYQKALGDTANTRRLLELVPNTQVEEVPSGCCGMAGSFGYEKKHYEVSMACGEEVLFPAVRSREDSVVVAAGISCRHQIEDGTGRKALHPVVYLAEALH